MKGREKLLQELNEADAKLETERKELEQKRHLYETCDCFAHERREAVLKHILPMISAVEGTEYVDHTFKMQEPDHYRTEWFSPYEGQYGVNGAELAATSKPYEVQVKGESFEKRLIVDKATCDTFESLSFSVCEDYKTNLSKLLSTKKFFAIKGIGFRASSFADMFPYVAEFLERLADWRIENNTSEIPEEVFASIAESVTASTLSKTEKGNVKKKK